MKPRSFAVLALWGLLPLCTVAATPQGNVMGIQDGGTITVIDTSKTTHEIRLSGIDAPEKKQSFGNASKQALSDMVSERKVTIEYEKDDRYGRKVGKVLVKGGDANLAQVRAGLAWHYKKYQKATDGGPPGVQPGGAPSASGCYGSLEGCPSSAPVGVAKG